MDVWPVSEVSEKAREIGDEWLGAAGVGDVPDRHCFAACVGRVSEGVCSLQVWCDPAAVARQVESVGAVAVVPGKSGRDHLAGWSVGECAVHAGDGGAIDRVVQRAADPDAGEGRIVRVELDEENGGEGVAVDLQRVVACERVEVRGEVAGPVGLAVEDSLCFVVRRGSEPPFDPV